MSAKTKTRGAAKRLAAPSRREPTHDEIALSAMTIWVEEGRPEGRALEHWLQAEARLRQACEAEAGKSPNSQQRQGPRRRPSQRNTL
ncbi:MAG: DUF2934 domain-containing protein [Proteobacteria bacterium]|nr:DUF2934 domain-containing protein [Pseudomonadota bacterium]